MGSHHHCQKAVRIRFTLWKVPVFQVLCCTFIHSVTYSTDIYQVLFFILNTVPGDTGWMKLLVPRTEDKIEDKLQP